MRVIGSGDVSLSRHDFIASDFYPLDSVSIGCVCVCVYTHTYTLCMCDTFVSCYQLNMCSRAVSFFP